MRALRTAIGGAVLVGAVQSVVAFSNIWNVDGWDAERLRDAGIAVCTWKHPLQGEYRMCLNVAVKKVVCRGV